MIIIAATIEGIRTRKDRTVSISIGTQELSPEKAGNLLGIANKLGYLAFKPESFTESEADLIESLKTDFDNEKSPSKRLRGVLYVLFQQKPEGYKDFHTYYDFKMTQMIEHFKAKIDD